MHTRGTHATFAGRLHLRRPSTSGARTARRTAGFAVAATAIAALARQVVTSSRSDHVLDAHEVRSLYDRIAPGYDLASGVSMLFGGVRLGARAIDLLDLRPGDTAVDLGCGTGVNLEGLAHAVGPSGRVVGVDLSAGMLAQARRRRAVRDTSTRIDLVQADLREYALPADTRGVLSTFAMEMVPEYDQVISRACTTLARNGGRLALSGLRRPPGWPEWAVRMGIGLTRPFGVSRAYEDLRPWEALGRHADEVAFETALFSAIYLSVGEPHPLPSP